MSKRLALVVGNSEYEDSELSQLKTPEADVRALVEVLEAAEIGSFDEVKPLINQPAQTIRTELELFFDKKKKDDLLLLYFSGHGGMALT